MVFGGFNTTLYPHTTVHFSVSNLESIDANLILDNQDHTLVLVRRNISLQSISRAYPPTPPPLSPLFIQAGQTVGNATKLTLAAGAGSVLVTTALSMNIGPGFIKLFQIIEIMGKLYFIPVYFTPTLDYFLSQIFQMSDLISTSPNTLISEQARDPNGQYGKLTSSGQPKNVLRAIPLFVPVYAVLCLICALATFFQPITKKSKILTVVYKFLLFLKAFVFEMNFVDFIFYGTYCLLGLWETGSYDHFWLIASKLISVWLIYEGVMYLLSIMSVVFRYKPPINDYEAIKEINELILGGLNPKYHSHTIAKLYNSSFYLTLFSFQVLLPSTQHSDAGVILMMIITTVNFTLFCYLLFVKNCFDSWSLILKTMCYEMCLLCLFLSIFTRWMGFHHIYIDYLTIGLTLLCILSQGLFVIQSAIDQIRKRCRKT